MAEKHIQPLPWHVAEHDDGRDLFAVYDANDVPVSCGLTRDEADLIAAAVNGWDEMRQQRDVLRAGLAQAMAEDWAARNCHMLARRRLNGLRQRHRDMLVAAEIEAWEHVQRICEEAGVSGDGVLRHTHPPAEDARLQALRDALSDLVDACYMPDEGRGVNWRVCMMCDTSYHRDEPPDLDAAHDKGCSVRAAEITLANELKARSDAFLSGDPR